MATSYTTDKKINALDPIVGSLAAADEFVVNKSGDTLKTTLAQVEAAMFAAKTSGTTPQTGDVVVVRRGSLIRQLETQNLVPDGAITKEKIAAAAGIEDSKLAKITTAGKVGGGAITDGTISGTTAINTSGAITTSGNISTSGNIATTGSGTLAVAGTSTFTGLLTANGGVAGGVVGNVTGNADTATTLATGRTIALTGDVTYTSPSFNGSANVTAAATIANDAVTTAKIASASSTTTGVTDAKLRHSAGLSLVGRSANSTGSVADITAASDNTVLRRSGTAIGFGKVTESMIDPDAKLNGATGGGTDRVFYENDQTVNTNYTIATNKNAMSAGPITVASGVTVTVPDGSTWTVV
jgi:hypothetical protein